MNSASATQADALAAKLEQKNRLKYICRTAALSQKSIKCKLSEIPTDNAMLASLSKVAEFGPVARSLASVP
jgi:hypothetical protein